MQPDFHQINTAIAGLQKLDRDLQDMFVLTEQIKENVCGLCREQLKKQAAAQLRQIPVEELKNAKAGIRTAVLSEGGYHTLYDLYLTPDAELCMLNGMGEKQTASVRRIIDEFLVQLSGRERLRLSAEGTDEKNREIICALARYRNAEIVCADARELAGDIHSFLSETIPQVRIRNRLHWLFSFSATKDETMDAWDLLEGFMEAPERARAERLAGLHREAASLREEEAFSDFRKNSASYYALLERLTGTTDAGPAMYGSVSAKLAADIKDTELDLASFRGDLRSYQRFGAQYVLHQKRVLLGDEMGLGKTIQAIAVMAHLHGRDPGSHFLIVCPASVLINWCREIRRFSTIPVQLLHGSSLQGGFAAWKSEGGAAVTNYESMRHLVDGIDEKMSLALLVIDEAHYIKNPEAQRTRYIRRLEDEAEHIMLMTGTPLENHVDEMCELIGFVQPQMVPEIRAHAGMRRAAAFREMLSPVYLRRQADQVLEELPERIENEEWCAMTAGDLTAYRREVETGNLMTMRRVSFLQDDCRHSAKCIRLLELCSEAMSSGLKVVVYSYFRETLKKTGEFLREALAAEDPDSRTPETGDFSDARTPEIGEGPDSRSPVIGEINGSTDPMERQALVDAFTDAEGGRILLCQTQAGGTGLNIQTASIVIFTEPQIKPSLEHQAIARVHRMGQIRSVRVYHLLCEQTVDEAIRRLLEQKEEEFLLYAEESEMADAEAALADQDWIRHVVEQERRRYLPAVVTDAQ